MARAAVRRRSADARSRQDAGRPQHRHRRRRPHGRALLSESPAGLPFPDLLEQVAARRPAPGGGSSAAWTCALAAALVEMAAAFVATGPSTDRDARELGAEARRLRATALTLAERELESYAPVLAAMRRDPGPERDARVRETLSEAAQAPLSIARCGARVAEIGVAALDRGSEHLRGDAIAGVVLAEAACASAARLVSLNLEGSPDDDRHAEAAALAAAAACARAIAMR